MSLLLSKPKTGKGDFFFPSTSSGNQIEFLEVPFMGFRGKRLRAMGGKAEKAYEVVTHVYQASHVLTPLTFSRSYSFTVRRTASTISAALGLEK